MCLCFIAILLVEPILYQSMDERRMVEKHALGDDHANWLHLSRISIETRLSLISVLCQGSSIIRDPAPFFIFFNVELTFTMEKQNV
jgi:hypothetical protein